MTPAHPRHRPMFGQRVRIGVLLHRWHRRLGAIAGGFLIWLAASGILLNESAALHLDEVRIDWPWLMGCYGLRAESPATGWEVDGHWLAAVDDNAVLDGRLLEPPVRKPLGMASAQGLLYIAMADSLVLLQADGARVDTLHAPPLPIRQIRRIGNDGDRIAIQDLDVYSSVNGEDWNPIASAAVRWSQPQALPDDQRSRIARMLRPSLPLARILADAHSGRIFGRYGVAIINTAGICAIVLAISGLWLWQRVTARHRHAARV